MWIFTNEGFISVRARRREHLQSFALGFWHRIREDEHADYKYRISIKRDKFISILINKLMDMDYTNFKDSIDEEVYHDACMDVWWTMMHHLSESNLHLPIGEQYGKY